MKKIASLLLCATILVGLCSCNSDNDNSVDNNNVVLSELAEAQTQYATSAEITTEPEPDFDIRLAGGEDENSGDMIWLLAREREDYSGTTIEVAVTKGGKTIVDFSSDSPFVENGGLFYGGKSISDIERETSDKSFQYIGDGCFAYDDYIIYNCFNQKSINLSETDSDYYAELNYGNQSYIHDRDNIVLVKGYYADSVCILNTETMELKKAEFEMHSIHAYGNGLFAGQKDMASGYKFYDINGTEVLDISNYGRYIYSTDSYSSWGKYATVPVFSEGKCTFYTKNDQNHIYRVTIDKQGNVLESEKM